jgi:6-pyruvoyl-tetrahydropterin synthase
MQTQLFYNDVTNLDFAYFDSERGAVGESLRVSVLFTGALDHEGILFDFSKAKNLVKEIIDRDCDHRYVVPRSLVESSKGELRMSVSIKGYSEKLEYSAPESAYCLIESDCYSVESLKTHLEGILIKEMPENVSNVQLELVQEVGPLEDLFFHYTHGLKDHYGNCQRLIHGHRSTLKIFDGKSRRGDIEKDLIDNVFNGSTHFCFWENVANKDDIQNNKAHSVEIQYQSSQGSFYASWPVEMVSIVSEESTVENLGRHIYDVVAERYQLKNKLSVFAYEGIGKGSLNS